MHRTELQAHEGITVQTRSSLTEEDRTRTLNLDNQCDDWDERQETEADYTTHGNIEGTLENTVRDRRQRLTMVRVNRLTHKVLGIQMQLIFAEQTRQIIEVHHVLVTETHDLHNLVRFLMRQAAENLIQTIR